MSNNNKAEAPQQMYRHSLESSKEGVLDATEF